MCVVECSYFSNLHDHNRSGKTKTTKNSNEAEYRAIFDNLIADLLTVLYWPDWPASSVLLGVVIKFMVITQSTSSPSSPYLITRYHPWTI